ncbi:DUF6456 domain-containing protein [Roseisalinus antarcticus]|uniref:DUF6456 domain-containing protein n=1 Tax=Roseisalinus antarcticus TaxID=254357 RepID=A0A1Y5RAZ8_9RHOB|nr:DUF6456 domain-containing protein [Roseisalinus antarcticus]SLN13210.1 hypothetical protein ROA7023_00037 [Roseisalinus antarcticus]
MKSRMHETSREIMPLPGWVPESVRHYLAHTESGLPIRALARRGEVHASTVLRQVRKLEARRDDPLVDGALRALSQIMPKAVDSSGEKNGDNTAPDVAVLTDQDRIDQESIRILRRLCETGATLAVARDMDRAVVVRDGPDGEPARTAMVERGIAQILALQEWIASDAPAARIARYRVTATGRTALRELVASVENAAARRGASGMAEAQADFHGRPDASGQRGPRFAIAESPLAGLARRRDRDGKAFLRKELVAAGERLREDFELAQMGPQMTQDWSRFVTAGAFTSFRDGGGGPLAVTDAKDRVAAALADLGPGLGDVVLRCCCYLDGMEETEQRMGWSARSGKIVLRIALERLRRHYDEQGTLAPKIG